MALPLLINCIMYIVYKYIYNTFPKSNLILTAVVFLRFKITAYVHSYCIVDFQTYGDGALLLIPNVGQRDADVYRCTGIDPYGRQSWEDFILEVVPGKM